MTSITASTPYRAVNPIRLISTVPAETLGDTPADVGRSPKTSHGCRPISVKIQPNELAASGRKGSTTAQRSIHRPANVLTEGARPRRVAHSIHEASAIESPPAVIIARNVQYVTGMFGA